MKINKKFSQVQYVTIGAEKHNQRVDNFLISALNNAPKSLIYRIIRKGEVRVNKKRVKPDYRLCENDLVRLPPLKIEEKPTLQISDSSMDFVKGKIIFENQQFLALNKPSGLAVHGGTGISTGLIHILRKLYVNENFIELIHRLDRETSGCLLIAKTPAFLKILQSQWLSPDIHKYYYCLVKGRWPRKLQQVDLKLRKNQMKGMERVVEVSQTGKPALTEFEVVQYYPESTLLQARLMTGRTHQIRVHTAASGHPIAGDLKYGDKEFNRLMKSKGLDRLFLHSKSIILPLEFFEAQRIDAPLPKSLENLLASMV